MNKITEKMLKLLNIKNLNGAYNIREDGNSITRNSTKNIIINSQKDKSGITIKINDNTKNENVYIPVVLTKKGHQEKVYNDFFIGDNVNINIIAGCAIHNEDKDTSVHEGIHTFHIGKNSKITYTEEHIGNCNNKNNKIINNTTTLNIGENSEFNMITIQKRGVDTSDRITSAELEENAKLFIDEKLIIGNNEKVSSIFNINLNKSDSSLTINSKTIAKDNSISDFNSKVNGNAKCFAHIECDAIIMNNAKVSSTPTVVANHKDAELTHEAAIGKIAKEQIEKLMSLGLSYKDAEETIINNFIN